jgi:hypothetical protein
MKYYFTDDYIYIQEEDGSIRGVPLNTLSNMELWEQCREFLESGAELDEDIHLTLKVKK